MEIEDASEHRATPRTARTNAVEESHGTREQFLIVPLSHEKSYSRQRRYKIGWIGYPVGLRDLLFQRWEYCGHLVLLCRFTVRTPTIVFS